MSINPDRADLEQTFQQLTDEELLNRAASGGLTELAQSVALAELAARGLSLPAPPVVEQEEPEPYQGDMQIIVRQLTATEAQILCALLNTGGIPADTGDTNIVQTHALIAIAVGGACIRVPQTFVAEAKEMIAAFRRGEFAIRDDFDPDNHS